MRSPVLLTVLCFLLGSISFAQNLNFADPVIISSPFGSRDVHIEQMNNDELLDLVVVGNTSDDLKVHIAQGDLSYNSPWSFSTADSPQRAAVGDFNEDGFPDVAVTSSTGDVITVRLNNQNGALNSSATYSAGNTPIGICTGDFNNDNHLDLAVAIDLGDQKAVYLGNGDGTFQSALISNGGDRPQGIVSGDVNEDGLADLLVCNKNNDDVSVFLGNGDGTFGNILAFSGGGNTPEYLKLADLNNDDHLDVVVSNLSNSITVLLGDGAANFETASLYPVTDGPKGLDLADLNRDGIIDVAVACETSDSFSVLLGNGDGTLQTAQNFDAGNGAYQARCVDMNEDEVPDIVVANRSSGGQVYIFINDYCPQLEITTANTTTLGGNEGSAEVSITGGTPPYTVTWGDENMQTGTLAENLAAGVYTLTVSDEGGCELIQDVEIFDPICDFEINIEHVHLPSPGLADGVLQAELSGGTGPFTFTWNTPNNDTSFIATNVPAGVQNVVVTDASGCPEQESIYLMEAANFCDSTVLTTRVDELYFGDLNGDDVSEFIGLNSSSDQAIVYEGDQDGSFANQSVYEVGAFTQNATLADFNGDGILDMIATAPDLPNNGVVILFGNGEGGFEEGIDFFVGSRPWDVDHDDLDNDGDIDLLVSRDQGNNVRVYNNLGNGAFTLGTTINTGTFPKHMYKADFNEDGLQDFAVSNSGAWSISILLGDGSLFPDLGEEIDTQYHPYDLIAADVDNDDHLDLITGNFEDGFLSVHLGNGDGTFQEEQLFETPELPLSLSFGDYNKDGFVDITSGSSGFSVSLFPGSGDGTFEVVQSWNFIRPLEISTIDFDGDADDDLVFALNSFNNPDSVIFFENCLCDRYFDLTEVEICEGDSVLVFGEHVFDEGLYSQSFSTGTYACDSTIAINVVFGEQPIIIEDLSICANDSVFLEGAFRAEEGTYFDFYSEGPFCDTLLQTNLSILPYQFTEEEIELCPGEEIELGGEIFSAPSVVSDTLAAVLGCDSIVETTLILLPYQSGSQDVGICLGDSIFLQNAWQFDAGVYFDTIPSVFGCDSIVESNVEILDFPYRGQNIILCPGDSLFAAGEWQFEAGNYTDFIPQEQGCDSMIVSTLSFYPSFETQVSTSICENDSIWLAQAWQNEAGTYLDSLISVNGCDSLVFTTLNVDPLPNSTVLLEICAGESINIGGEEQSLPGIYPVLVPQEEGCDSVYFYNLSLISSAEFTQELSICSGDSILLQGEFQQDPGVYTDFFPLDNGCDSVLTSILSVDPLLTEEQNHFICAGDSILIAGEYWSNEATFDYRIENDMTCDSIVTVNILVDPLPSASNDVFICEGDSVFIDGAFRFEEGTFEFAVENDFGCDSVITTNLYVNPLPSSNTEVFICEGDSVLIDGEYRFEAGTFTNVQVNGADCDSLLITELFVNPLQQDTIFMEICNGYDVLVEGNVINQPGTYAFQSEVEGECDSLKTYVLIGEVPLFNPMDTSIVLCDNGLAVDLLDYLNTSVDFGVWSGEDNTDILNASIFDPTAAQAGTFLIEYNVSADTLVCDLTSSITITVETCISVEELSMDEITLFPNPSDAWVNIQSNKGVIEEVRVMNALGQEVFSNQFQNRELRLNFHNFAPGLYSVFCFVDGAWMRNELMIAQ